MMFSYRAPVRNESYSNSPNVLVEQVIPLSTPCLTWSPINIVPSLTAEGLRGPPAWISSHFDTRVSREFHELIRLRIRKASAPRPDTSSNKLEGSGLTWVPPTVAE